MVWTTPLTWNTNLSDAEGKGIVTLIGKGANNCITEVEAFLDEGVWHEAKSGKELPADVFQPRFFAQVKLPSISYQLMEIAEQEAQEG
jgi:hypothetical protein